MLRFKSGVQLKIISGSLKSITGKKCFICEPVLSNEDLLKKLVLGYNPKKLTPRFKLAKTEFLYDSDLELYEALKLTKEQ